VKYKEYEEATFEALCMFRDKRSKSGKQHRRLVLMVVGAGRGPLVKASLRAGRRAFGSDAECANNMKVYALDKNPNAVVTLQNLKVSTWGDLVTVINEDMRNWNAPEKADILVSELLGSFGDNELSPECLDGAQKFLRKAGDDGDDEPGISIPCRYKSFVAPVSSSKLFNEVRNYGEKNISKQLMLSSSRMLINLQQQNYVLSLNILKEMMKDIGIILDIQNCHGKLKRVLYYMDLVDILMQLYSVIYILVLILIHFLRG